MATHFGQRLAELREGAGLTQYRLAQLAGLSKQAVSKLEKGDNQPNWETVQVLALALGVDCTAFADRAITLPPEQPPGHPGRPRKAEPAPEPAVKPAESVTV